MKYYRVQVLLGHVGTRKSVATSLYIEAENIIKAIENARNFPGVKHSRLPDQAIEISFEEYTAGRESKDYNEKMTQIFNSKQKVNEV